MILSDFYQRTNCMLELTASKQELKKTTDRKKCCFYTCICWVWGWVCKISVYKKFTACRSILVFGYPNQFFKYNCRCRTKFVAFSSIFRRNDVSHWIDLSLSYTIDGCINVSSSCTSTSGIVLDLSIANVGASKLIGKVELLVWVSSIF